MQSSTQLVIITSIFAKVGPMSLARDAQGTFLLTIFSTCHASGVRLARLYVKILLQMVNVYVICYVFSWVRIISGVTVCRP